MADFQPPPTYALPILVDEDNPRESQFSPIWLKWFIDLVELLNAAGGTVLDHNSLSGLQGGTSGEYYHLTAAQHTDVTAGAAFKTIVVSGQASIVADSYADSLTIVAGTGIVLTTDAGTDTLTISGTAASNAFGTIAVPGQSDVVADSAEDTLNLVEGGVLVITTTPGTDTVTFTVPAAEDQGYWSVLTDGDATAPELIFAAGDAISVWVPL